jgi:structure-specific endonuclease subunit SLX1
MQSKTTKLILLDSLLQEIFEKMAGKAPEGAKVVEDFYGVYLLYCMNPKYTGRNYIGFTVDPNRRIVQHNRGTHAGGAWKTSNRGPWEMVLIVHGFPNDISALRFEWAWQHPKMSRRLNQLPPKKSREKSYDYHLRLLATMLNIGPWNRLPLTVRWLKPDFAREFPAQLPPPLHMPIVFGPVRSRKIAKNNSKKGKQTRSSEDKTGDEKDGDLLSGAGGEPEEELVCNICLNGVEQPQRLVCLNFKCSAVSHIVCLSSAFLSADSGRLLPVQGECPTCGRILQWGELIRKKRGCHSNIDNETDDEFPFPDDETA